MKTQNLLKSVFGVAVIALLLPMVSCDAANNPSALVGRWVEESGEEMLELLSDGTGIVTISNGRVAKTGNAITWKTEKDRFYIIEKASLFYGGAQAYNYKVQGSVLTFTEDDGKTSKYTKCYENCQAKVLSPEEQFLKQQKEVGVTLATPIEVTVKISGEDGYFVKCGVQLEYNPSFPKLGEELEARRARIKDIVIDLLKRRTLAELMTNEGKQAVREQILTSVNDILPEFDEKGKPLGKVSRSYFDSFMIQ